MMNPEEVAKLVEEENRELEEVLHKLPPEVVPEPEEYPLRKKTQILQLSSVPVGALERVKSILYLLYRAPKTNFLVLFSFLVKLGYRDASTASR